jgi:hypothetical protein
MRGFLLPSRGSPGRSISRFYFSYGFYLLPAAFTSWAFSPFFPQDKMYPGGPPNSQTRVNGMDERGLEMITPGVYKDSNSTHINNHPEKW